MFIGGGTMELNNPVIVSFDIFDTVVTRRVGQPRAAFLLLGRRLHTRGDLDCSAHAFANARTAAEIRTFRNAGGLDSSVTLQDIYAELGNALHLSGNVTERFYQAELQLEEELLVALPDGQRRVERARLRGDRIAYVSDMYLPSDFLEAMLRERGLFVDGDIVIVSNEQRASKATGRLWPIVLAELNASPDSIRHVGNDDRSDGYTARKAGIPALVLEQNNLNRYERALEHHSEATDGLSSALAGASRIARLDPPDATRTVLSDVAAGVVAPFVIGHLLWTLEVARREGLAELFFVARDGQLLCEVARILASRVGYTGKITYIYGSRQAWSLAGLGSLERNCLVSVIPDDGDVTATLRDVLSRLELSPEELSVPLAQSGFDRATWNRPVRGDRAAQLRAVLCEDPEISRVIQDNAQRSRDLVLGYLADVGAVTNERIGFVDLGTGATLFNSFSSIVASIGQPPPLAFYFGLRSEVEDVGFGLPLTYVRNEDEQTGFLRTPGLLTLVELACTADHGSVVGYDDSSGSVVPVFDELGNQSVVDWGLPVICETVRRVAEELILDPELVGTDGIDLRPAMLEAFELFWSSPTTEEAQAWGAYPFEDGWGEQSFRHPIAEARGLLDTVRSQPHRHWWEQGASQLSGPVTRRAFKSRQKIKDAAGKVRNRLP